MHNVCIPYTPSAAWGEGEELRYALRSWDVNFESDFTAWVIGDKKNKPAWLSEKVWIDIPDEKGKWTEYNTGKHLKHLCERFDNFFWSNDDIILLRGCCDENLKRYFFQDYDLGRLEQTWDAASAYENLMRMYDTFCQKPKPMNRYLLWQMLLTGSIALLKKVGNGDFPLYNWETHTPYYYESGKLSRLADIFPVFDGLCLTRTVYGNVFIRNQPRYKMDPRIRGVFYKKEDKCKEILEKTKMISFGDAGLNQNPEIKEYLMERFQEPSRWEI